MIYVIDDADDYRFLVQAVFSRFLPQYSLRLFADGLDLIRFIGKQADSSLSDGPGTDQAMPGLIVLDVDMPKRSGFQTLGQLKQNPLWKAIPVVMMSSRLDVESSEAALLGEPFRTYSNR